MKTIQASDRSRGKRIRSRLRRWWRDNQWFAIGGIWLTALVLGYIGFAKYYNGASPAPGPGDLFYLSLQLFTLDSGGIVGPKSWELELARVLAPTVAMYTALKAFALFFSSQLQIARLRFIKDHVVICGLGRKGFLLAKRDVGAR